MKKINSKGFTLIELLAVITIMGILMMAAIPAVSRTIENTRRDTFATLAKTYINAVRNANIGDELKCGSFNTSSATTNGYYYFPIDTTTQTTKDIMESGGMSSWGNTDVRGYVAWKKINNSASDGYNYTYYAVLVDIGNHGIGKMTAENDITRSKVLTVSETTYEKTLSTPTTDTIVPSLKNIAGDANLQVSDITACELR